MSDRTPISGDIILFGSGDDRNMGIMQTCTHGLVTYSTNLLVPFDELRWDGERQVWVHNSAGEEFVSSFQIRNQSMGEN